jgi:7,8-dihydroneopterin aldolase/epimerase/oxygenase
MITIELVGLELHGHHGVLDEEVRDGQRFVFDVTLGVESPAPTTDRIEDAVDYREVVELIREVSQRHRFHLLEALAQATADALVGRFPVRQAQVRVRKPEVALGAPVEFAAVTATASAEPSS